MMFHAIISTESSAFRSYGFINIVSISFGGTIQLPQTGQTSCYDSAGNTIDCAGTGQDGELRAGVLWPNPRFMDNGFLTVTDHLTGLMWTKDSNAPGPTACSPGLAKTWQEALDYVACLNTHSYLGYTDWRLPNVNELWSLMNAGQANSAEWLNNQGFSNALADNYWSSTTYASYTTLAWTVGMHVDGRPFGIYKTYSYNVWPVRGGQCGSFGNSTICISKTGQTLSYAAGDDGSLQAGVAWPNPRFTNEDGTTPVVAGHEKMYQLWSRKVYHL